MSTAGCDYCISRENFWYLSICIQTLLHASTWTYA